MHSRALLRVAFGQGPRKLPTSPPRARFWGLRRSASLRLEVASRAFLASSTGFGSRCSRIRFRGKSFSMYQRLCSSASINAGRRTPQPVRRFASRRYVPPARGSHISARYRPCPAPDNGLFGLRRTNTDFEGTLTGVPFLICAVCVCVAAVPPSQTERHAPPRVWIITLQPCHTGQEVLPGMFFA